MKKPQPKQQKATRVPVVYVPNRVYGQFEQLADEMPAARPLFEHLQPMSCRHPRKKAVV